MVDVAKVISSGRVMFWTNNGQVSMRRMWIAIWERFRFRQA